MRSVSVVIPVKDGERFLAELLDAVVAQGADEVLVIDSGSRDGSVQIARAARGVELLEIPPAQFGHGRTRNLGAERTGGELVCFLTQDAVPTAGWLAAYREAFELEQRVGSAYGPHLPRPETSPMIARELAEFFASMSPEGGPRVQGPADLPFLSNVNACYARACWEEIRFAELPYAEDQAFVRAMAGSGWRNVYHPAAAVVHAHDYGPVGFARRYFDEYRGLRATAGHVEPAVPGLMLREVGARVARDERWMRERGWPAPRRALWVGRATVHHSARKLAAVLGSHAERLPATVQRAISLEGSAPGLDRPEPPAAPPGAGAPAAADVTDAAAGRAQAGAGGAATAEGAQRKGGGREASAPRGAPIEPSAGDSPWQSVLRVSRAGPTPLADPVEGMAERRRLHVAVAIPPFRRGSGGHGTIFQIVRRLEERGHTCTIWVHDARHGDRGGRPAVLRRQIVEWFAPVRAPVFVGFEDWHGADVAVATGWDTVHSLAELPGCRARAYLINDHEPEFYATSAEDLWARDTYRLGFYPISASPWLRDLVASRYGCDGGSFRLGVDHRVYGLHPVPRREDTVIFYAREGTPRRAVPLGVLALQDLVERRPGTRVVMFGQYYHLETAFPYELLGVATPGQLALNYCEATVGLCLSLTNYSLIPQEMMACGLPCVDVAGGSSEAAFGSHGPVELAEPDPVALAGAMESLLADRDRWRMRSEAGVNFVADANWHTATAQVEAGLREALRSRLGERGG